MIVRFQLNSDFLAHVFSYDYDFRFAAGTPTKDGKLYYQDEDGEYWAVCVFIGDTIAYQKADTPELAYQGGKGIGKFQAMLSDFTECGNRHPQG